MKPMQQENARKKRLGQYFSGSKVSELLVSLAAPSVEATVIDPMAGCGDMLVASIKYGLYPNNVFGIEIDPIAGGVCQNRLPSSTIHIGDAFFENSYKVLGSHEWDMVITNPPYVRYQSLGSFEQNSLPLQNAKEIRLHLIEIIKNCSSLSSEDKEIFIRIAKSYSGLSDLAVPAWILCAALVKNGGTLAMVVPESWISREYALSIKYLLLNFFDIQYVVEDLNSVWFSDALVKTNLIVAKRVKRKKPLTDANGTIYKHIRLAASLIGPISLVEKMEYSGYSGPRAFRELLNSNEDVQGDGYVLLHKNTRDMITEMANSPIFNKLLLRLEKNTASLPNASFPRELYEAVEAQTLYCDLKDLQAWGFFAGQGLRTGANKFFYVELDKPGEEFDYVIPDSIFGNKRIAVAHKRMRPVLRYQSDAGGSYVITADHLKHRLLYIQEDFINAEGVPVNEIDNALFCHIKEAEKKEIISAGKTTHFQQLTAVKPNIRNVMIGGQQVKRDWYMLPRLAARHTPSLCMSRVNYKDIKCNLVSDDSIVVDANFSTLWMETTVPNIVYAMFAILNSSWTKAYFEVIATVMGGGALKVEASHIRQLLLPAPTNELISSLSILGHRLAECSQDQIDAVTRDIDVYILSVLFGTECAELRSHKLSAFLRTMVDNRQR
jgi:hypothetical protein